MGHVLASTTLAIDVEQTRWGFDGQVVAFEFNQLNVLITNSTENPVEGTLRLSRKVGNFRKSDGFIDQPFYVSPFSSRWVPFYPFVIGSYETWSLSWGDESDQQMTLPPVSPGKKSTVMLVEPNNLTAGSVYLKRMPDNLFPPTVTATHTLKAVVLDHYPTGWEEPRRIAFREWLHQGGTVHLLENSEGAHPRFPNDLSELNRDVDQWNVGSGFVFRHSINQSGLNAEFVESSILRVQTNGQPERDDANFRFMMSNLSAGKSVAIFSNLKSMLHDGRAWWLIYLIAIFYIVLVFPGCYLIGQKGINTRKTFGSLFAIVAICSTSFLIAGRRDEDLQATIRSVAVARALPGGYFDVIQWTDANVAQGGDYTFTHNGSGRLYATASDEEKVKGTVHHGSDARFTADIPPYSSRTFCHRTRMQLKPINAKITDISLDVTLQTLEVSLDQEMADRVKVAYAAYGSNFYRLSVEGSQLKLRQFAGNVTDFLDRNVNEQFQVFFDPEYDKYQEIDKAFVVMCEPLVTASLELMSNDDIVAFELPLDRVRLFLYTKMPDDFHDQSGVFGSQTGYVLYSLDVLTTGKP